MASKIKGYTDGKLFITSDNLNLVKYSLEKEVKEGNATKASYYVPGIIFSNHELVNGKWEVK